METHVGLVHVEKALYSRILW